MKKKARICNLHTLMCEDIICGLRYYKGSDRKAVAGVPIVIAGQWSPSYINEV